MNKKVCSFPILFALLALLIGTCAVVFPASAQAAPTSIGSITVSGTVARSYDAYQIFSANLERFHHGERHRGAQLRRLPDL